MTVTLEAALSAASESDAIDFKRQFDPLVEGDWCELLKDILAIGNSGGGAIVLGVDRAGSALGVDQATIRRLDPAAVGDKIHKYTGGNCPACTVGEGVRDGKRLLVILIGGVRTPVAFEKAGTYVVEGRQKCAFQPGTIYFRHNTKSEPGTTEDIEVSIELEVARRREEWLGNIRQVMEAPAGSEVRMSSSAVELGGGIDSLPVRLTNDPAATLVAYKSRDITHPYRLKELCAEVKRLLPAQARVSTGDIIIVRRAYRADDNPNWVDRAKHASIQYSDAFRDWLVEQFSKDARFSAKAKLKARREP